MEINYYRLWRYIVFGLQIIFISSQITAFSMENYPCMGYGHSAPLEIPNQYIEDLNISPYTDDANFTRLNITIRSNESYGNVSASIRIFSKDWGARCYRYGVHDFHLQERHFLVPRYDYPAEEEEIKYSCKYIIDLNVDGNCILFNDSFSIPNTIPKKEVQEENLGKCLFNVDITNVTLEDDSTLEVIWKVVGDIHITRIDYYLQQISISKATGFKALNNVTHYFNENISRIFSKDIEKGVDYKLIGNFFSRHDCYKMSSMLFSLSREEELIEVGYNKSTNYTTLSACSLIILFIIFSVILIMLLRRKYASDSRPNEEEFSCRNDSSDILSENLMHSYVKVCKTDYEDYKELEIPPQNVQFLNFLGDGAFGEVFSAKVYGLKGYPNTAVLTAVKRLKDSTPDGYESILEEIKTMHKIKYHRNIVQILGCCTLAKPYMIIMELVEPEGSLITYLKRLRKHLEKSRTVSHVGYKQMNGKSSPDNRVELKLNKHQTSSTDEMYCTMEKVLDSKELQNFSLQIAKGMEHLENLNIVHRDLAARNILINHTTKDKVLKISDFGMSKIGAYFSYMPYKQPARWMALESLKYKFFNTKSDVWSFGVVLWEIGTLGVLPYKDVDDYSLTYQLSQGRRLGKPQICTSDMYSIMRRCWQENPKLRPSFGELVQELDVEPHKVYVNNLR